MDDGAISNEIAKLRQRVAELEAQLAPRTEAGLAGMFGAGLSQREALLTEAERVANMGSWLWDTETGVIRWSSQFYELLGYDESVPASTEGFFAAIHPDDLERVQMVTQHGLETGVPVPVDFRIRRPDGELRFISMNASVVAHPDGRPVRMVGTLLDITERMQMHEQLHHAQKMQAIGTFAGGLAHELNNCLHVVHGYAEVLSTGTLAPAGQRAASQIQEACERAVGLTRQLLTFSRKRRYEPTVLCPGTVVQGVESMVRKLLPASIELTLNTEPGLPNIHADHAQLEQVLLNLTLNARDAMPRGGALRLRVHSAALPSGPALAGESVTPQVCLCVEDTGEGMGPEVLGRIFEPFFTTKPVGMGTGLGLAVVYGIVQRAGGNIDVQSEPGRGTTVRVVLPGVDTPVPPPRVEPREPSPPRGEGRSVLVVDDEPEVRGLVAAQLRLHGYEVEVAQDGVEALHRLEALGGKIDLVLTDLRMPRMDGVQLAKELRLAYPDCALVTMSGHDAGVAVGGRTPALTKPFRRQQLLQVVHDALRCVGIFEAL